MSGRAPLVAPRTALDPAQLARYSRHLTLPGVGEEGQRRIAAARVLVIGAGGLGSPISSYLIAAGVGTLAIMDDDTVELSNLQRQIMHRQSDVGARKVDSVPRLAAQLNDQVQVVPLGQRLTPDNALELFAGYDLVIDGSDNFATRYLSNDAAELTGTPLVWGTLFQFSGQVSVFDPRTGPMLRDLFPEIPDADSVPSCAEGGVFGALCGVVGSIMAVEALKLITGTGETLSGKLWLYDALSAGVRTLSFERDPQRARCASWGTTRRNPAPWPRPLASWARRSWKPCEAAKRRRAGCWSSTCARTGNGRSPPSPAACTCHWIRCSPAAGTRSPPRAPPTWCSPARAGPVRCAPPTRWARSRPGRRC